MLEEDNNDNMVLCFIVMKWELRHLVFEQNNQMRIVLLHPFSLQISIKLEGGNFLIWD